MGYIRLEGLEFFAYHGYHPEEQKIGNQYQVDVHIECAFEGLKDGDLTATVDYARVYAIVSQVMSRPAQLLESLCDRINEQVMTDLPHVKSVETFVSKYNPPIGGVCHRATVSSRRG